ncbi:MAG: 16S rRNA (cytosine(1402)-N(4))-methyltransferase RsmH [Pyrinomonadaceae bacterium]
MSDTTHVSVLLKESIEFLEPEKGGLFVDATLGMGGHTEAILESSNDARVIGFDQDPAAIHYAAKRLQRFGERVTLINENFSELKVALGRLGINEVTGVLADLGVSSLQLDDAERGFSFRSEALLDMRMNPEAEIETAYELMERLEEEALANVIFEFGEERFSRRIARRIKEAQKSGNPVRTTTELADLVRRSVPKKKNERVHPATKTFQALRIAVNGELTIIENFIVDAVGFLPQDGRIAIISFHSLEDRIVKRVFQKLSGKCTCPVRIPVCICGARRELRILTKRPVAPTESEQIANPRSRSAKLRAACKLGS